MLMMSYIIVIEVIVTHKTDSDTISCHSCFSAISWKYFNSQQTSEGQTDTVWYKDQSYTVLQELSCNTL